MSVLLKYFVNHETSCPKTVIFNRFTYEKLFASIIEWRIIWPGGDLRKQPRARSISIRRDIIV